MLVSMSAPLAVPEMSASEYLEWEREQVDRHEYYRGEVFQMAGGSPRHSALAAAIIGDLRAALRGSDCRVLSSDQRVVARAGEHYVYPDVTLVCGPLELAEGTGDVLSNPTAIFEVLSRSTEPYDRGDKWAGYQQIPSLLDYLLVSQVQPRIERFQRQADGSWRYEVVEAGTLALSRGPRLDVGTLYDGILELPGE